MLNIAIATSWLALAVWGTASVSRGPVFWAVLSFVLSQTVYVPVIAALLAEVVGSASSCNQFMNVWGLLSAFAVVVSIVLDRPHARRLAVALGGAAAVALVVLARVEEPDPVGCIAELAVPWTSAYWWILVVSHVGSSALATVVCARLAHRSWPADRSLALGSWAFASAFLSSTLFWTAMGVVLVTGRTTPGTVAQTSVFPLTVLATTAALVVVATDRGVRLARARGEVRRLWERWAQQTARLRPHEPLPQRRDVVGPWWRAPAETVHQLRVQVADNDLLLERSRSGSARAPSTRREAS